MDILTCTTDECKDEFDFDMQNVKVAQPKLDTCKPLVSLLSDKKILLFKRTVTVQK